MKTISLRVFRVFQLLNVESGSKFWAFLQALVKKSLCLFAVISLVRVAAFLLERHNVDRLRPQKSLCVLYFFHLLSELNKIMFGYRPDLSFITEFNSVVRWVLIKNLKNAPRGLCVQNFTKHHLAANSSNASHDMRPAPVSKAHSSMSKSSVCTGLEKRPEPSAA